MKKYFISVLVAIILMPLCSQAATLPRPEYPRPQFERTDWVNLNGTWTYTLDQAQTGVERNLMNAKSFDGKITVPFAPESKLSGVAFSEDFIKSIWYQRNISIPAEWQGRDILLNFGAVYYQSEIYIDGKFVARHFGGSDSFSLDITAFVTPGQNHSLVVCASSDLRSRMQPAGKQSLRQANFECMYTRTTGIWQTVWMEAVSPCSLERVVTTPDIDAGNVSFRLFTRQNIAFGKVNVIVTDADGKLVGKHTATAANGSEVVVPIRKAHLWSPEDPYLYNVRFEVVSPEGAIVDKVSSYFGMRKIHVEGKRVFLNNEPYYQRLVLDQGFYPDGIWTAPSDEALRHDIELSKSVGFNGARLHQKVFEERFHYWADRLGYLTWGEFPSWGLDANDPLAARNFLPEWCRVVERDQNHPSIITWTPFNEEFWPDDVEYPRFISDVYDITRALDPTRPINTVSGGVHIKTDIWTYHDYEQNADKLRDLLLTRGVKEGPSMSHQERHRGNVGFNRPVLTDPYDFPERGNIPYIVDEFGGIRCMESNPPADGVWGYGDAPATKEEFYTRLASQVKAIVEETEHIWGYCYTQLTDVQQEQNGIFYFDRTSKYDAERLKAIFGMPIGK